MAYPEINSGLYLYSHYHAAIRARTKRQGAKPPFWAKDLKPILWGGSWEIPHTFKCCCGKTFNTFITIDARTSIRRKGDEDFNCFALAEWTHNGFHAFMHCLAGSMHHGDGYCFTYTVNEIPRQIQSKEDLEKTINAIQDKLLYTWSNPDMIYDKWVK
jgi:hypothetical protein